LFYIIFFTHELIPHVYAVELEKITKLFPNYHQQYAIWKY
jgi:hypothetical protein